MFGAVYRRMDMPGEMTTVVRQMLAHSKRAVFTVSPSWAGLRQRASRC